MPSQKVLRDLAKTEQRLAASVLETLLILPEDKAAAKAASLLNFGGYTSVKENVNTQRISGDSTAWNSLTRGVKTTQPSVVVIDRAGFVRRAQSLSSWAAVIDFLSHLQEPTPRLELGQAAPAFAMRDMNGTLRRLEDYRGRNLLITFFPKCFTGHCTNHLTSIQAVWGDFVKSNTEVLAVSVDPAEGERGQLAFAKSYGFGFPFIPDTGRNLSILYGAANYPQELASRMSVLIDGQGIVRWISRDVVVSQHGADVLEQIKSLGLDKTGRSSQ